MRYEPFLSYATGGELASGEQRYYPDAMAARFFHAALGTLVETSVIERYEIQSTSGSHTAAQSFVTEYARLHGKLPFSIDRARKIFMHIYFAWALLEWWNEFVDCQREPGSWRMMKTSSPPIP